MKTAYYKPWLECNTFCTAGVKKQQTAVHAVLDVDFVYKFKKITSAGCANIKYKLTLSIWKYILI
jgi:hypothetical protein